MIKTIIAFIIVFGTIVFVHEFGHYFFAKKSNVLVREFSIGMGPKIFWTHKNGTTYTIRLLPIGGYVRMAGLEENDDTLRKGMIINLVLDKDEKVTKINSSSKKGLVTGIPVQISDWDLEKELWIEGFENGDENLLKRYSVSHDAMIIEEDGTEVKIAPIDVQFQSAKLLNRLMINFAGPMNNFILAIVTFIILAFVQGGIPVSTNQIGKVMPNSVAQKVGIQKNDKIIAINNHKTKTWEELSEQISKNPGKKITVEIKRDNKTIIKNIVPSTNTQNGKKTGAIGIQMQQKFDKHLGKMLIYGFTQTIALSVAIISAIAGMFTHGFSLNDLGGPVAMYSMTSEAASYGAAQVIGLLAALSINLGIVNLLPIPALDGGKILLNIIEGIRKKPLDSEKENWITLIGVGFLLLLMILVTWNDIQRYFLH